MRLTAKSPSYLIRKPHSYCFRLNVLRDLQKFVGRIELRYSLKTGRIGRAKSKARLLAGKIQLFFRFLRENPNLAELTDEQIQNLVNQ